MIKIKSHTDLKKEMLAVARGAAPKDAAAPSVESAEVLLTPENRDLMKILRDRQACR
jgi:hypothetical protein